MRACRVGGGVEPAIIKRATALDIVSKLIVSRVCVGMASASR